MKQFLPFLLMLASIFSYGQEKVLTEDLSIDESNDYEVSLMLGLSSYEGDLHCFEDEELGVFTNSKFAFGVSAKKNINEKVAVGLSYRNTKLVGDETKFSAGSGHNARGYSFTNTINELTVRADYTPFASKSWKVQPYTYVGFGIAFGNPETDFKGSGVDNPSTDDLINRDMAELKKSSTALPFGFGIKADLTDKITLGLEGGLRFMANDYIDGVSLSGNDQVTDYYGMGGLVIGYKF